MAKAKVLNYEEFIEYARQHYNRGGDSVYECWDERTFNEYVEQFGPITKKKALGMFRINYSISREYRAMAKW
jgi:hypothetical protein